MLLLERKHAEYVKLKLNEGVVNIRVELRADQVALKVHFRFRHE